MTDPDHSSFECEDCRLAEPDDCLKAGHCEHRDGPPFVDDVCQCPACRSDMADLVPCMREARHG